LRSLKNMHASHTSMHSTHESAQCTESAKMQCTTSATEQTIK
jgi:hypothetical protein